MMDQIELLDRIAAQPGVFEGKPVIRGMRIAVEHVLEMLAAGDSVETVLQEYPDLEPEDLQACLPFADCPLAGEHVHGTYPGASPPLWRSVGTEPQTLARAK